MTTEIPSLTPVTSSQILAVGHSEATMTLFIQFKGHGGAPGSVYSYANVPKSMYLECMTAPSVGSWFYKRLKYCPESYPYKKLT